MKNKQFLLVLPVFILVLATLLTACGGKAPTPSSAPAGAASGQATSSIDGATLLQERCTRCHSLDRVTSSHKSADQWATTVTRMVGKGAQLNDAEKLTLVNYLGVTYP